MAGVPNAADSEPVVHGSTMGSAAPHIMFEKSRTDDADHLETVQSHQSVEFTEAKTQNAIEALGIEDWQAKEKKIVRRLDMTLLPQLWILYSMCFASCSTSKYADNCFSVQLPKQSEYCVR